MLQIHHRAAIAAETEFDKEYSVASPHSLIMIYLVFVANARSIPTSLVLFVELGVSPLLHIVRLILILKFSYNSVIYKTTTPLDLDGMAFCITSLPQVMSFYFYLSYFYSSTVTVKSLLLNCDR